MMACRQRLMTRMSWSDLPDAGPCSKRTGRIVMRTLALFMAAACTAVLACPVAARAEWPERPVKLVVTFPPGSANDAAARIFADGLARKWGKPVVVEAKTGAEGTIGVASFVSSQDDHTLLYTVSGSVTVAPLLIDKLPYDVDLDLKPIAATTAIVLTLAVSNSLSVGSIPELISVLRSNPGKYAWTSGPTLPRYVFASFLKQHGLKMNFVSYRDASQPQADLGEGRIQALMTSLTASSSPVQTGKARFLGGRQSDPRRRTARASDRARTWLPGTRDRWNGWNLRRSGHVRSIAKSNRRRHCGGRSRTRRAPEVGSGRSHCAQRHDRGAEGGDRKTTPVGSRACQAHRHTECAVGCAPRSVP